MPSHNTMSSSIIARVLQDCFSQLEGSLHSEQLVGHLYSESCINLEDLQDIRAESTQFAKSRKLIHILSNKDDSALDQILAHLHSDGTQSHLERLIYESALKFGYGSADAESQLRKNVQILSQKWWPEHKELIKSFVDRSTSDGSSLVQHLRQQLLSSDVKATAIISRKQAIVGMGGIGKTSTAKWYANTHEGEYDHVIWVDSEGATLGNSLGSLGRKLGLTRESSSSLKEYVRDIYERLQPARCLFVFDNAERFDGENGLRDLLPRNELHHSIITSRNRDWGNPNEFGQIPTFQLDVFTPEECVTLMSNTLGPIGKAGTKEEILALGAELGFLPVALQCAVATILKSRSYTLASYTKRIQDDLDVLVDKKILTEYERPISATLNISIEQIDKDEDIAVDCREWCKTILIIAAYCEPDDIPKVLFLWLPNANADVVSEAFDLLIQYSLVSTEKRNVDGNLVFGIHRLLQHVIRRNELVDPERAVCAIKLAFEGMKELIGGVHSAAIRNHGVRVWELAAAQFDEILLDCHEFPLVISRWLYRNRETFLKDTVVSLRRVFKETDLPVFRLQLRMVELMVEKDNAKAAKMMLEMEQALDTAINVPHTTELKLHLRVAALDLRNPLITHELNEEKEMELLDAHKSLLEKMSAIGYDGKIAGESLCHPSEQRRQGLTLRIYTEVCYSIRLHKAGRADEAIQVVRNLLNIGGHEIDDKCLYNLCKLLKQIPGLLDSVIETIFRKLQPLFLGMQQPVAPEHVNRARSITKKYVRWLWKANPSSLEDNIGVLEFLLMFDWDQKTRSSVHETSWYGICLQHIARVTSLENNRQELLCQLEKALGKSWEKLVEIIKTNGGINEKLLTRILILNNNYSQVLLKAGNILQILEVDAHTLNLMKSATIDWVYFHFQADSGWLPMPVLTHIGSELLNASGRVVLESKLGILSHIIGRSISSSEFHLRKTVAVSNLKALNTKSEAQLHSLISTYDSACSALVLLERKNEALSFWSESIEFILKLDWRPDIRQIAQIGKQTLKLLEERQEEESLSSFMRILEKCVLWGSTKFLVVVAEAEGGHITSELKDIAKLTLRLLNCKLWSTAFHVISRVKKCDFKGVFSPLIQIQLCPLSEAGLQEEAEVVKGRLLEILNSFHMFNSIFEN